jgi:hypothetical protein
MDAERFLASGGSKGYSALTLQHSPAIDDLPTHRGRCSHDCFPTIFTWMQNVF